MGILIFNLYSTAGKNERHKAPFSVLFHCLTSTVVARLYPCHAHQLHSAEKKLKNSMSIKYVLSFQMSPRVTKFCVTYNMLPASYGFTRPALTFVDGILLDGSTQLYSMLIKVPTWRNNMQTFIYCKVTLHVSGVTAPIIRSTKNCNRYLWYRS